MMFDFLLLHFKILQSRVQCYSLLSLTGIVFYLSTGLEIASGEPDKPHAATVSPKAVIDVMSKTILKDCRSHLEVYLGISGVRVCLPLSCRSQAKDYIYKPVPLSKEQTANIQLKDFRNSPDLAQKIF